MTVNTWREHSGLGKYKSIGSSAQWKSVKNQTHKECILYYEAPDGVGGRGFRAERSAVYRGRPVTSVSVLTEGQRSAGSSWLGQGCFWTLIGTMVTSYQQQ